MNSIITSYLLKLWGHSANSLNQKISSCVESSNQSIILDLGCDNGVICTQRFSHLTLNPIIIGTDINLTKLKTAKSYNLLPVQADSDYRFPFKNNSFDIITANQLIEHLNHIDLFIKEIHRLLKPKGYAIIATENLSSWHNLGALLLGWQAFSQHISQKTRIGNPLRIANQDPNHKHYETHIKIFTPRGLKELLKTHNLKVELFFGAGYYPLPPIIANIFSRLDPIHSAFIGCKARKIK